MLEDHADLFPFFPELPPAQGSELAAAHNYPSLRGPLSRLGELYLSEVRKSILL